MKKYTTYPFVDSDPIMDVLTSVQERQGVSTKDVSKISKVSASTLNNWKNGRTKRPQFATVAAAAGALNLESLPLTAAGRAKLKGKAT